MFTERLTHRPELENSQGQFRQRGVSFSRLASFS